MSEGEWPTGSDGSLDVVPDDVTELVAFVDAAEAPVVALRWWDGDDRRSTFAFDVAPVPSGVGSSDGSAVDVWAVDADSPIARPIPLTALDSIVPLPTADEATAALPDALPRRAALLRGLATHAPELVEVGVVLCLLASDRDDVPVLTDTLRCLTTLVEERPDDCVAAIPQVHTLVTDPTNYAVRAAALTCLAAFAAARPGEVVPYVESVFPAVESSDSTLVTAATTCVSHVASADPESVRDATEPLVDLLTATDATVRLHAAYALGRVAVVAPEAIRPAVDSLVRVVSDGTERTATRLNATCAVGRVTGEWPDAVVEHLPTFVDALADADDGIRANAAGVVGDVATTHAIAVRRHVGTLFACLDDDDSVTRANGSTALARVAREFPGAVCPHVDRLVDALDDDDALVRENACWTLGYLRGDARRARPVLERVRTDDGNERVRGRAAWALDEVADEGVGATD